MTRDATREVYRFLAKSLSECLGSLTPHREIFRYFLRGFRCTLDPFGAPKPLPILNPSNFVPPKGFPVVKGSTLTYNRPWDISSSCSFILLFFLK